MASPPAAAAAAANTSATANTSSNSCSSSNNSSSGTTSSGSSSRLIEFPFAPYQLTEINYKTYDGIFDRGINMYPRVRSGHRICSNETDLFLFGGFNPAPPPTVTTASSLFAELWRFNKLTHKWSLIYGPRDAHILPKELASHSMCMWGKLVLIYGGTGYPFGSHTSNSVWLIDPYHKPRATVRQLQTTGDQPFPQYGQAIAVQQDQLFVVGGTTGHAYSIDVHRLDLRTLEWQWLSQGHTDALPEGRYRSEIVVDEDSVYVFGGGTSELTFSLAQIWVFGVAERKWRLVETLPDDALKAGEVERQPEARKCHACVRQVNGDGDLEAVVCGGTQRDDIFFDDVWVLNLRTLRWRLLATVVLPHPLHFHAAATDGHGAMYIFGGIASREDASERTNELFRVWTMVPTLAEISWTAMTSVRPRLMLHTAARLLEAGVPQRFVRRVHLPAEPADMEEDWEDCTDDDDL